jgi:hypothetical protein
VKRVIAIACASCWTGSPDAAAPVEPVPVRLQRPPGEPAGKSLVVRRTERAGVMQLEGERPLAIESAHILMEDHCGKNNYVIVQEGDEELSNGRVEWRLHYHCAANP